MLPGNQGFHLFPGKFLSIAFLIPLIRLQLLILEKSSFSGSPCQATTNCKAIPSTKIRIMPSEVLGAITFKLLVIGLTGYRKCGPDHTGVGP